MILGKIPNNTVNINKVINILNSRLVISIIGLKNGENIPYEILLYK